jgi:hypothetical protein
LQHRPSTLERFVPAPELAPLEILDAALAVSESALYAAHLELAHGDVDRTKRGSCVMRANAVIVQARRLGAALAAYRHAVDRDALRAAREVSQRPFPF